MPILICIKAAKEDQSFSFFERWKRFYKGWRPSAFSPCADVLGSAPCLRTSLSSKAASCGSPRKKKRLKCTPVFWRRVMERRQASTHARPLTDFWAKEILRDTQSGAMWLTPSSTGTKWKELKCREMGLAASPSPILKSPVVAPKQYRRSLILVIRQPPSATCDLR
jgi:hypothetical protein